MDYEEYKKIENANIYYSPEKFGLTVVATVDNADSYEFNMFVIFEDKDGIPYYASDSGCSCPTPFEDIRLSDLKKIDMNSFRAFQEALKNHYKITKSDISEVEKKVKDLLKKSKI